MCTNNATSHVQTPTVVDPGMYMPTRKPTVAEPRRQVKAPDFDDFRMWREQQNELRKEKKLFNHLVAYMKNASES